jgi:dihydroorotate dehydrogenase
VPGSDAEALVADYTLCAAWAADAGADIVEVHLACPDPFAEQPQMVFENIPLSAQILYRVRTTVDVPVVAKLGAFRTPRGLHETATKLAPWAHGFALVHAINRWVVDEKGNAAFDGTGRDRAEIMGSATFPLCSRQVLEMISWRRAGAWDRPILAMGGVTTVDRARGLLREGADTVMVGTAAIFDPLFAVRFRQALATAAA